jgi:hypothetical protein
MKGSFEGKRNRKRKQGKRRRKFPFDNKEKKKISMIFKLRGGLVI